MVLWRICRHRDLRGISGFKAAGRWHYAGHPIVYLAEAPASALLDVCVHTSANDVPPEFTLLKIEGPDLDVPSIGIDTLPDDWQTKLEVTRDLGTSWLDRNENVILCVPSAIVPQTMNCLFNRLIRKRANFVSLRPLRIPSMQGWKHLRSPAYV